MWCLLLETSDLSASGGADEHHAEGGPMGVERGIEAALDAARGWPTTLRHSWRDELAADHEISQARLQAVIDSSEAPLEYL